MLMKIRTILVLIMLPFNLWACGITNLHDFMKVNLDDPTIKKNELVSESYPHNITIVKYTKGCGFMGCIYNIFKEENKCFSLLGTYQGKLKQSKGSKNDHPIFRLSYPSGDKVILYFDPKKNQYVDK